MLHTAPGPFFEWRALGPHLRLFDWQQAGWAVHETRAHVRLDICAVCVKGLDDFNSHAFGTSSNYTSLFCSLTL